jgi:hypothetical protein
MIKTIINYLIYIIQSLTFDDSQVEYLETIFCDARETTTYRIYIRAHKKRNHANP